MDEQFLIGTYTNSTSKGIYQVTLDHDQQRLVNNHLVVPMKKPQYLRVGSDHTIYTIERGDSDLGGVAVYQLTSDGVRTLDKVMWHGPTPAYLGLDEKRHFLFAANYHGSCIDVFKIHDHGKLEQTDHVVHRGQTGPRPEQEIPHVHYADLTPDDRLITCDLGEDLLTVYDVSETGKLTEVSHFQSHPGFGTRHLVFHPNGHYVYVVGELSSEIEVFEYDSAKGQLDYMENRKTIPATWDTHNGAAAIRISRDGRFLYVTNRGENTVAVFKVLSDYTLEKVQSISTAGEFPRDINFSRDQQYLIAANQNTNNLTLFQRDVHTGKLTLLQKNVSSPEAINVEPY